MKNIILVGLLFILNAQPALARDKKNLIQFSGTIKSFFIGEFDPILIGKACVVEIEVSETRSVGMISNHDECLDQINELKVGRAVTVAVDKHDLLTNSESIEIFRKHIGANRFYYIEFGYVDSGLASE